MAGMGRTNARISHAGLITGLAAAQADTPTARIAAAPACPRAPRSPIRSISWSPCWPPIGWTAASDALGAASIRRLRASSTEAQTIEISPLPSQVQLHSVGCAYTKPSKANQGRKAAETEVGNDRKSRKSAPQVIGPAGEPLTTRVAAAAVDDPLGRARKAEVVAAVNGGLLSVRRGASG